jgi:hypothetical protein
MSQSILLVVTEISPGIRSSSNSSYTYTPRRVPGETPGNNPVQTRKSGKNQSKQQKNPTPGPQPEWSPRKIRGVLRGKHVNSPVTQIETGNSPVQKNFHTKRAPIQHKRGTYSKQKRNTPGNIDKWSRARDSNPRRAALQAAA